MTSSTSTHTARCLRCGSFRMGWAFRYGMLAWMCLECGWSEL